MLLHAPHTAARPTGPSPLALADLVGLTRRIAAEVRDGQHAVVVDPDRRWFKRLQGDDYLDVWLIGWATEQAAELHDHGGSLGALSVVSGALTGPAGRRTGCGRGGCAPGRSVGFGLGHVHDVTNSAAAPAVSVHAYSPPLTAMSYYSVQDGPRLRRTRSELVDARSPGRDRMSRTIDVLLSAARARLDRPDPRRAAAMVADGAILVDTRPAWQRAEEGELGGALLIERNHIEWRLDPTSDARIPEAVDHDVTWIVVCSEGYASSLAAASLQDLGLRNATDLDGGYRAWKAAGLPVR